MAESPILKRIILTCSRGATRLFRQNVGTGWVGEIISRTRDTITLRNPRPLHAGLCKGSSDAIGWTTIVITPDMVGRKVAVFTAVEAKDIKGRVTEEQRNFLDVVRSAGGIAGVARSPEEAQTLIDKGIAP